MNPPTPSTNENTEEAEVDWIPEGYTIVIQEDDERYVVPEFFVPALHQIFDGYRKKEQLEVFKAAGSVQDNNEKGFEVIGEGMVMAPTIPRSSDRERLSVHAEVLALQDRLGISYKDASHRLYMAELEKLKAHERMFKAFSIQTASTKKALERAYKSVKDMEGKRGTGPSTPGTSADV